MTVNNGSIEANGQSRGLSAYEDLFVKTSPGFGTTCQWMHVSRIPDATINGRTNNRIPCTIKEIVTALHLIHQRFVPLRCILEKVDDDANSGSQKTVLTYRPELEPIIVVDEKTTSPSKEFLEQLAAEEVTKGMGPMPDDALNRPLWKATILGDSGWIVVTFHHTICDGTSRKMFTAALLDELGHGLTVKSGTHAKSSLAPGLDDLLEEAAAGIPSETDRQVEGGHAPCWPTPDATVEVQGRKIQAPSVAIPNVASRLREKCRSNGVTVTAAIIAALMMAVQQRMKDNNESEDSTYVPMRKIGISVDARRHLPNNGSDLFGCYAVHYKIENPVCRKKSDNSVWSIAPVIAEEMKNCSSLNHALSDCRRLKAGLEFFQGWLDFINGPDQGRGGPLNVSNIGIVEGESSFGTVQLDEMFSISSQTALGCYVFANMSTIRDDLFVTLGSVWPMVSEENGRAMLKDFVTFLLDACQ